MLFKYEFDDINIKHMIDETPHEVSSFFYNHTHENEYELLFFIQGSARLMLDNSLYSLYPNTLVIIKPGLEHQVIVNRHRNYERIVINLKEDILPKELKAGIKELGFSYLIKDAEAEKILMRLEEHSKYAEGELLHCLVKGTVIEALAYLCFGENKVLKEKEVSKSLSRMLEFINKNVISICSIEDLVSGLNLSKSAIYKEFKDNLHVSPMQFIKTKKCMMAQAFLRKGAKACEIYEKCGFSEYTTFYRSYISTFGISPSKEGEKETQALPFFT
mgnify:CR=1 FL=1